mgnify:FL=1
MPTFGIADILKIKTVGGKAMVEQVIDKVLMAMTGKGMDELK